MIKDFTSAELHLILCQWAVEFDRLVALRNAVPTTPENEDINRYLISDIVEWAFYLREELAGEEH